MKKFNIRTLLLLVISVVTVFAFAACQPKDNGGDSGGKKPAATGITYQSFVDKLFDAAAKGIGGTAVNGANDLALSFDLDITLRLDENKSVPVALSLTAFLDQTSGDVTVGRGSAVYVKGKLAFIDFELIYLLADAENVYIKSAALGGNANYKVPVNIITAGYQEGDLFGDFTAQGGQIAKAISGILNGAIIGDKTILGLVKDIASDFGSTYSVNATLARLVKLLGLDLNELLGPGSEVGKILGGDVVKTDAQGNIKLDEILKTLGSMLSWSNAQELTNAGAGKTGYELTITSPGLKTLAGALQAVLENSNLLGGALTGVLFNSSGANFPDIYLSYVADSASGKLESLGLSLVLNTVKNVGIDFKISNIKIANAADAAAAGIVKPSDAKQAQLNLGAKISLAGGVLKLNYDPTSESLRTWAGGAFPADFWKIGETVLASTVNNLNLDGNYDVSFKLVPDLTGNNGLLNADLEVTIQLGSAAEVIKITLDKDTGDIKLNVTTAAGGGGLADVAARYALNLVATLLIDDTNLLINPGDANNAAIATIFQRVAADYESRISSGTYELNITDAVWEIGLGNTASADLFGGAYPVEKGHWFDLLQKAIYPEKYNAMKAAAQPSADGDNGYRLFIVGADGKKLVETISGTVGANGKAVVNINAAITAAGNLTTGNGILKEYTFTGFGGNAIFGDNVVEIGAGDTVIYAQYTKKGGLEGYTISIINLLNEAKQIIGVGADGSVTIATKGSISDLIKTVYGKYDFSTTVPKFNNLKNEDYINADAVTKEFVSELFAGSAFNSIEGLLNAKATITLKPATGGGVTLEITANFGDGKTATVALTASISGVTI